MNAKTLEDLQAELARQDAEFAELETSMRALDVDSVQVPQVLLDEIEQATTPPQTLNPSPAFAAIRG